MAERHPERSLPQGRATPGVGRLRLIPLLASLSLGPAILSSCGEAPRGEDGISDGPGFSVVDSAGVLVAWNALPRLNPSLPQWELAPPDLRLGGIEDDDLPLWRFTDAVLLPDGRLMVSHAGGQEVLVVDSTGQVARTLTASGDGPGEFRSIEALTLLPDGDVAAVDRQLGKLLRLSSDGQVLEEAPLPSESEAGAGQPRGIPAWGTVVHEIATSELQGRHVRMEVRHVLLSLSGEGAMVPRARALGGGPSPFGERYRLRASGFESLPIPGTPSATAHVSSGRIVLAPGDAHRFQVFDAEGTLRFTVHTDHEPVPLTNGYKDQLKGFLTGDELPGDVRSAYARTLDEMPWPDVLPATTQVLLVRGGREVWVQEPMPADENAEGHSLRWAMYDLEGEEPGRRRGMLLDFPLDARLLDVRSHRALLVRFPELGSPVLEIATLEGVGLGRVGER